MALVACPDCGTQVSDLAPACPRCARPVAAPLPQRPQHVIVRSKPEAQVTQLIGGCIALASLPTCAIAESPIWSVVVFLVGCLVFGIGRAMAV